MATTSATIALGQAITNSQAIVSEYEELKERDALDPSDNEKFAAALSQQMMDLLRAISTYVA